MTSRVFASCVLSGLLAACATRTAPVVLEAVAPDEVRARAPVTLVLSGGPFLPRVRTDFDRPARTEVDRRFELWGALGAVPTLLATAEVDSAAPARLAFSIGPGVLEETGVVSLEVRGPSGERARLEGALRVIECSERFACAADELCRGGHCVPSCVDRVVYRDVDGDGFGVEALAIGCDPVPGGYADLGGDCDDGDPLNWPGGVERCDLRDNDCDGAPEPPGVCPADPLWNRRTDGGDGGYDWRAIASFGRGAVWLAGAAPDVRVRDGAGPFTTRTCTGDWYAAWAPPGGAWVALGGTDGSAPWVALQPHDSGCQKLVLSGSARVTSLVGFGDVAPSLLALLSDGRSMLWTPPSSTFTPIAPIPGATMSDVHGPSPALAFAVGQSGAGGPAIYRLDPVALAWRAEPLPPELANVSSRLRTVRVVSDRLAFAVGDASLILTWDGSAWSGVPPPAPNQAFRGLYALSEGRVYVASTKLWARRDGGWEQQLDAGSTSLFAIGGSAVDDLWVAGNGGFVAHWPE